MRRALWFLSVVCLPTLGLLACSSSETASSPAATPGQEAGPGVDAAVGEEGGVDASAPEAPAPDAPNEATAPDAASDAPPPMVVDELVPVAAEAICGALFRCCDTASLERYFAYATAKPSLESFQSQVPPAQSLDESGCRDVVAQMLALVPFGSWIANAKAGRIAFEPTAVTACVAELQAAACGTAVSASLSDGTCFGFDAPVGGAFQRRMFKRTAGVGTACVAITNDGFGAGFFGTCDPTTAFCCIDDPANTAGGCGLPKSGLDGTCQQAGSEGDTCEVMPPLALCSTGLSCDSYTGKCAAQGEAPLAAGDACVDAGYNMLGLCEDSWCDVFGSLVCEPLKDDGQECFDASECTSGECDNTGGVRQCAPWSLCVGP